MGLDWIALGGVFKGNMAYLMLDLERGDVFRVDTGPTGVTASARFRDDIPWYQSQMYNSLRNSDWEAEGDNDDWKRMQLRSGKSKVGGG